MPALLLALAGCAESTATGGAVGAGGAGGEGGVAGQTSASSAGGAGGAGAEGGAGGGSTASSVSATASSTSSGPSTCGNGVIDDGEACEGLDFGGKTCADFGLSGGSLLCNAFCQIIVSGCTPKESCFDGTDNDGDGFSDCADDECASAGACLDSCQGVQTLLVPAYVGGALGAEADTLTASCTGPLAGPEAVFSVIPAQDGDVLLTGISFGFDVSISVRTTCGDTSTEFACVNDGGVGVGEVLTVQGFAGEPFYVVVESVGAPADFYSLDALQPFPESFCDDFYDDDFDGLLDCDDPTSCQGTPTCMPGTNAYGTSCTMSSNCAATGGDPICLDATLGFPGGYCSEFCAGPTDCGATGVCIDLGISLHGVCFGKCNVDTDCSNGLSCVDLGNGQKICDKEQELNCQDYNDNDFDGLTDCEDSLLCASSPSCVPGTRAAGVPCQLHNQCAADANDPLCIDSFNYSWPLGYCSQFCDLLLNDCPTGSTCAEVFVLQSGSGVCLDDCSVNTDCRSGYTCLDLGYSSKVCAY